MAVSRLVSNRSIYLWLDHSHEGPTPFVTGPKGEVLDKNPLKDPRVRMALSLAIKQWRGVSSRFLVQLSPAAVSASCHPSMRCLDTWLMTAP